MFGVIRLSAVALIVLVAMGSITASSAWAEPPETEDLTKATERVTFHGHSGLTSFIGEAAGVIGRVECEKDLVNGGSFLVPGKLAEKFDITLSGKCAFLLGSTKPKCTEPILTHTLLGLLGFIKAGSLTVGLLVKPETGTEWLKAECEGSNVTVRGEVVGEIPEIGEKGNQYNKIITLLEVHFARVAGKENEQAVTTFELPTGFPAPLSMTGIGLSTVGALGGKAALESTEDLLLGSLMLLRA